MNNPLKKIILAAAGAIAALIMSAPNAALATTFIVPQGGTGLSSVTSGALLYGNGTGNLLQLSPGSSGQVLQISGGLPTWSSFTSGAIATSSSETSGRVPFWTSTAASSALLSGGVSGFAWNDALSRLTATNLSFTLATGTSATTTNFFSTTASSTSLFTTNFAADGKTLYVDSTNHKVGIGTTTPAALLSIVGNTSPSFRITKDASADNRFISLEDSTSSGVTWDITNRASAVAGTLGFFDNTASLYRLVITSAGNVGIGITNPTFLLHVNGNASITDLNVTRSTTTAATSTNLFATNGSFTGLAVNSGTITSGVANVATGFRIANAATSGRILRGDGTNFVVSTATYPDTMTTGDILYASGSNVVGSLADVATGRVLTSGGVGAAPAWSTATTLTGLTLTFSTTTSATSTNLAATTICFTGDTCRTTWPTGSTVAGSDTQVQFNDGGSFAGNAGLIFNKVTAKLTATNFGATLSTTTNATTTTFAISGTTSCTGGSALQTTSTGGVVCGSVTATSNAAPIMSDYSDGATTTAATTTLLRDMYYDTLTVNAGVTLNTGGFRIFARTVTVNGTISNAGGNAGNGQTAPDVVTGGTGGTAGAIAPGGTLPAGSVGKVGGAGVATTAVGNVGSNGGDASYSLNAVTGAAAGRGGGLAAAGTGGVASSTPYSLPRNSIQAYNLFELSTGATTTLARYTVSPGSGSGSGGQGHVAASAGGGGGGSGASGGTVWISAETITIGAAGTITAAGGNGGNGGNSNGSASQPCGGGGGGGGGNGGAIFLMYSTLTNSGTITVAAGTKGTGGIGQSGGGNGEDGVNGTVGKIFQITN